MKFKYCSESFFYICEDRRKLCGYGNLTVVLKSFGIHKKRRFLSLNALISIHFKIKFLFILIKTQNQFVE